MRTLIPRARSLPLPTPATVARRGKLPEADVARMASGSGPAPAAHDFSRLSVRGSSTPAATGLVLGALDDPHEAQADRLAEQVMRGPGPARSQPRIGTVYLPALPPMPSIPTMQARRVPFASNLSATAAPATVHHVVSSPGQPLDAAARRFMEPRFNADFSAIRVHADHQAQSSADDVQAQAYTVGRHIVFGAGQYDAQSAGGRTLLAHELAHTLQNTAAGPVLRRRGKKTIPPAKVDGIHLRARLNEVQVIFTKFMFEREVLPLVFKDGKLSPGYAVAGSGDMAVTTQWDITGPAGQDLADKASPLTAELTTMISAQRAQGQINEQHQSEIMNESGVKAARAHFREQHDGHSAAVLDNIDAALARATRNNPNLLIAYYDYYAEHALTDELKNPKNTGSTDDGDTDLNPHVLKEDSGFPTHDPVSLLGETLIHEYVHTPQGGKGTVVEQAPLEAKAYAIELFFAERAHDKERADFIINRSTNDSVDMSTGSDKIFNATYNVISALYTIIDSGRSQSDARIAGDISAEEARRMSVEFISKNEADYGKALKAFVAKHG